MQSVNRREQLIKSGSIRPSSLGDVRVHKPRVKAVTKPTFVNGARVVKKAK